MSLLIILNNPFDSPKARLCSSSGDLEITYKPVSPLVPTTATSGAPRVGGGGIICIGFLWILKDYYGLSRIIKDYSRLLRIIHKTEVS